MTDEIMNNRILRQMLREADIEGLIADGAPADEYDSEANIIMTTLEQTAGKTVADITFLLAKNNRQNPSSF